MRNYLKLVNFEFNRFFKLYLTLIVITIVSQLIGVFINTQDYLNVVNETIRYERLSVEAYVNNYGKISFQLVIESLWFYGPVFLCVVSLLIYVFFIWYRDWFGKNTFIYRLLMLPTARVNLYLAKGTAILLFVLGLVSLQLLLLIIEVRIFEWIVPDELRSDYILGEWGFNILFNLIYPKSITEFFLHYGLGMTFVFTCFTALLFERCFRLKGIIYAVIYAIGSFFVFMSPIMIDQFLLDSYFYPLEILIMQIITGMIVLFGAIWIGNYLLNKKIRV